MNAIQNQTRTQNDWVINYLEINSRPQPIEGFRRLRMTQNEFRIDPADIVLSIRETTEDSVILESDSVAYLGKIVQRGNELIVRLQRTDNAEQLMFIAKKSVCVFEPKGSNRISGRFSW